MQIEDVPPVRDRVKQVAEFRKNSTAKPTRKKAETPHLFFSMPQTDETYLIIPRVSSERREYLPIAFEDPINIASDSVSIVPGATLFHFGILQSKFHNAWMRVVCGRLKSDYRYSAGIVYNNFPWPDPTPSQKQNIEACAQAVLDARSAHPNKSLAELYDPELMPQDLLQAHLQLDKAVEEAYGVDFDGLMPLF